MCMSEIKATYQKSLYGRASWYVVLHSQVYTPQTINMIICYMNALKFNDIDTITAEIKIQDQCFFLSRPNTCSSMHEMTSELFLYCLDILNLKFTFPNDA